MNQKRYIKLFNFGYFLSKHEPKLLKTFLNASESVPTIQEPLKEGQMQYQKEMFRDKLKDITPKRDQSKNKDRGIDMEI